MRTALDALATEHGVGVRLPRAASRSGLSMWLVSRRVDVLTHSFKLANMDNNRHFFLHTLICYTCSRALRSPEFYFGTALLSDLLKGNSSVTDVT